MSKTRRECLAVLGLPLTASDDDIRKAYRQKALELHPDKNQNDPNATERFQTLQEAYRTLVNDDDEEEVVIFVDPLFVIIKLMEMHERRRRMQREFGIFPFGPSPFGGCGLFSHHNHDDNDDDEEEEYFYQRNRSSRNYHTGSSSTGRRTTRFAATEHDRENIPKSKESHVKPKQNNSNQQQQENMTPKKQQKKKGKGGWNTTKKKKNQRNTQWGKMSSNTNNDEKESNWSEQDYFSEEYENCHDFQEFPNDKNATAPLPNEEKKSQKDRACKTSMTTESKQKTTNITEQNSATVEKSTGHDKHSQNDEAKTPNNIQTEENSSSSFKMKSTQEPSKKEENIEEHENTSSLEEPSPVSSDRVIEDKVHTDPSQFTKTTAPTQEATNSKGVHVSSSEPRNIAKVDGNDDDVGVKRPSTCSTKSTSHLHEKSFTDQETVSESISFQTPKSCASTGPTSTDSHNQLGDVNNGAKVSRKQRKKNKKKQNEKQSQMEKSVENPTVQNACTESQRSYDGNTESSHTCIKTETESTTDRDSNADRIIRETETVIPKSKTAKTTAEKGNVKVRSGHNTKLPENAKDFQSKNISSTSDENGKTVRATNKVQSAGDEKIPVTGQRSSQHFQERQTKVTTVLSDEWPKTPKQDGAAKNVSKDQKLPVEEQNSGSGRGSYPLQDYPQYQQNWCGRINKPKESGNTQGSDWKFPSQEPQHIVNGDVKGYQFQEHPHYQEKPFEKVSKPKESGNAHVNDRKFPVQECARGNEENYQFQENPKESGNVRLNESKFQVREEQQHQNPLGSYKSRVHGYYQNLGVQQQQRQQQHIINGVPGGFNQERPQNQNTIRSSVTNARVRPNVSSPPSANSTRTFPVFGQQQQRIPQSTPTQQQELYVPQPTPQRVPQPTPQHVPQPTPQHASQPTRVSQQIPCVPQPTPRVPQQTPQRYVPQPTPRVPQPFHVTPPRVPQPFHVSTPRVPQPFHVPIPRVPQPFHVPIPRVPQPFHVPIPRVPQPQQRQFVQQQHHFHHPQKQQQQPNINGFVNHFQEIPGDFPSLYKTANTAQDRTGTSEVASNLDHKNIREQFDRYLDHHVDHTVADRCMKLISIARGEPTE